MAKRTCSLPGCEKVSSNGALVCPMHRQRMRNHGTYDPPAPRPLVEPHPCVVPGCEKIVRARKVCDVHYSRMRRTGTYDHRPPAFKLRMSHSSGYVIVHAPGHELARRNKAYEHQVVLFDAIGYGPHQCHWCTKPVGWKDGLEVDHVNHVRHDNTLSNLVPSCHTCNSQRRSKNGTKAA